MSVMRGHFLLRRLIYMGPKLVSAIIVRCLLLRGFESIEVYGQKYPLNRKLVSAVEGCTLRGVPLYYTLNANSVNQCSV